MLLEVGNERMPGHSDACAGDDCIEAFFSFALRAQGRADELKLGKLPFVLAIWACKHTPQSSCFPGICTCSCVHLVILARLSLAPFEP